MKYVLYWQAINPHTGKLIPKSYDVQPHQRGFSLVADGQATQFDTVAQATQEIRRIASLGSARGGRFSIVEASPADQPLVALANRSAGLCPAAATAH